ncbi:hypothetical protein [Streptomyces sp. JS01]|uniref:hypothetical protein n=1 Tax=Streptomyces sp. JS01 TaxID=1525753 RepID=UPI00067E6018|nr:hypothetical protein [Streptomyces sp. JS01]
MLNTRARTLAAVLDGGGWAHPYASPFVLYADGGGDGGDGAGRSADDGGDADDGGQGDDGDGDQDGDRDGDDPDDDTDKDLGDKGKKALRELRRENRTLKAQLRQHEKIVGAKPTSARRGGQGGDGDQGDEDPEAIRERAREEARAEVWTERVEAAAVAAAAGRLANPQLAARLLDLSDVGENDKGKPDRDAISELIDDLLEDEPYLAAQSAKDTGRRFQGGADGGARKTPKKTAANLGEAVANRLAGTTG